MAARKVTVLAETEEIELKEDGDFVLPGDTLAYAIEFAPGEGTHEDGEYVCASWTGIASHDTDDRTVSVEPIVSTPVQVRQGDDVIVYVTRTRSSMVIGNVAAVRGKEERNVSGDDEATLHISKISEEYVDEIEDAYRSGDILVARVISDDPSIQILTKGEEYGVLKAFCTRCRTPLKRKGDSDKHLECPSCEHEETRKLAEDYGKGLPVTH